MTIKHLVISGGYHLFTYILSSIYSLEKSDTINISNIETIWCVSSGSFVAICIALLKGYRKNIKNDESPLLTWEVIQNYIEERPWSYLFINPSISIYDLLYKKGIYDETVISSMIEPFLKLLDLPVTITLAEYYEYTNIDVHFYSFDIYQFQMIDICYKNYPTMTLVNAMYVTASVPFLSIPHMEFGKCFIDGGCIINYPICYALKRIDNPEEILGYNTHLTTLERDDTVNIKHESVFYYIYYIISSLYAKIYNTFICTVDNTRTEAVYQAVNIMEIESEDVKYYNEINLDPLTNVNESFYNGMIVLFQDFQDFLYSIEKRRCMWIMGEKNINIVKKLFTYNN
jgi:hypothetical protein